MMMPKCCARLSAICAAIMRTSYRVLRADSGQVALDTLRQLKTRNDTVALLLADQRMPQMDGVDFLAEAMALFPDAKRALLTAYADTDAAIRAINDVKIHHYLLKPWDPPEEQLYPVIDDLLDDWSSSYRPAFEGIRVLGNRWSPRSYEIRDFLARSQVPYQWLDIESSTTRRRIAWPSHCGEDAAHLPLVLFPTARGMRLPRNGEVADEDWPADCAPALQFYDLVIAGGGPGGSRRRPFMARRKGCSTLIVEREAPGGQAGLSSRIENYLGFPSGIQRQRSGTARGRAGPAFRRRNSRARRRPSGCASMVLIAFSSWPMAARFPATRCSSLPACNGAASTSLAWTGCRAQAFTMAPASAEAISCKDEDVYIVGGANSAGQAAMNFSSTRGAVVMLVRGDSLAATMSQVLDRSDRTDAEYSGAVRSTVVEVHGESRLEAISIDCDGTAGRSTRVPAVALFIFIGANRAPTGWKASSSATTADSS